jgi:hypothetical protein
MRSIIQYINEAVINYKKIHGHDRVKIGSIEWHFHNYEHGYKHCIGSKSNPYEVDHHTLNNGKIIHVISSEYARGHGIKRKPQWFKFNKKIDNIHFDLNSGKKINVVNVPEKFK